MKKYLFKWILYFIMITTSFNINADNNEKTEKNDTLIISHDYSSAQTISESSLFLKEGLPSSFRGKGRFDAEILGEKKKIILHNMQETILSFSYGKFSSVYFYPYPRHKWFTLDEAKKILEKTIGDIGHIKDISTDYNELNLDDITNDYMNINIRAAIGIYHLNHYDRLVIILRQLNTPQEMHPRDVDYFQVHIVLNRKN